MRASIICGYGYSIFKNDFGYRKGYDTIWIRIRLFTGLSNWGLSITSVCCGYEFKHIFVTFSLSYLYSFCVYGVGFILITCGILHFNGFRINRLNWCVSNWCWNCFLRVCDICLLSFIQYLLRDWGFYVLILLLCLSIECVNCALSFCICICSFSYIKSGLWTLWLVLSSLQTIWLLVCTCCWSAPVVNLFLLCSCVQY